MEDYIFIILAIVFSIIGLLGRKKKGLVDKSQSDEGQEYTASSARSSVWEQFLGEDLFPNDEKPDRPLFAESTPVAPITRPIKKQTPGVPKKAIPKNIIEGEHAIEKQEISVVSAPKRKIHPIMKGFSLNKAIVYSEILNRKY